MRIDKYLWAIRIFKTRSLSTDACRSGRIKLNNSSVKASHEVKLLEEFTIQKGPEKKIIKVLALLPNRVDAKQSLNFYEDLTPAPDPNAEFSVYHAPVFSRERGAGRPTKKDRRELDGLRDSE